ncbi:hypothetical protein [Methylobacterium nodulans]|uniref:Uncharacterized protein n=1 Tax=Methylobacterium nodulans (strain LMG 21967 / CNCM I-2342 / ORS 2060) TaxID=460265 RepID=B8INA6_METNO|nr:hypothetical protein [Methylobacterium nodulans]ACL56432.1 hypothetical protein Mnod_1436 [Methylobacterium nodulans ORS 2060]
MSKTDFEAAARILGWHYSSDHGGWIHRDRLVPPNFDTHEVAASAEEACRISGIADAAEAERVVREHLL